MYDTENPGKSLDVLIQALSEMAKPYGYVVEALHDSGATVALPNTGTMTALGIKRPGGEWLASMCATYPENGGFYFPGKRSAAAALVSKYGSRPAWDAHFFRGRKMLRFPGGSPEELALKAAAGVEAVLYRHWPSSS